MEEAKQLIEEIEKQLTEVKYHLDRGSLESAAIKSEYVPFSNKVVFLLIGLYMKMSNVSPEFNAPLLLENKIFV